MSGASIPQELVDELVDHFFDDYHQLQYFLATCTSFASGARYHIYRAIRIVTLRNLTGFFELCEAVPDIPLFVRALTIHPAISDDERGPIQLFELLKSLASLTIISYDSGEIRDDKLIAIARGLPLTTLVIEHAYLFPRVDEFASLIRGNAHLKTLCLGKIHFSNLIIDPFTRLRRPNTEQRIETLCLLTSSALNLILGYDHSSRTDPDANHILVAIKSVHRLVLTFETLPSASVHTLLHLASNMREFIIADQYPLDPYRYMAYGLLDIDLSRIPIIKVEVSDPTFGAHLVQWLLAVQCLEAEDQPSEWTNTQEITIVVVVKDVLRFHRLKNEWNMMWRMLDMKWAARSSPPTITVIITNGDHSGDICVPLLKQAIEAACPHLVSRARLNICAVKRGK